MSKFISADEFLLAAGATFAPGVVAHGTVEIRDEPHNNISHCNAAGCDGTQCDPDNNHTKGDF